MSQATNFFESLKENPLQIENQLGKIFKNKNLKIQDVKLLKDKRILDDRHKITVLLKLGNNLPEKIVLEIHDNSDYFQRNVFAQVKLKGLINSPRFFGKILQPKIIVRSYLEGEFFCEPISKKTISLKEISLETKKMAIILADLHNFSLKSLPKFLFKRVNKKIEKAILKKTLEFITPQTEVLRKKIEINLNNLLEKMGDLDEKNRISLIHGDYQPANFIVNGKNTYLTDFDTLEVGNPARDLGRFLYHMKYLMKKYSLRDVETIENLFLKTYLKNKKLTLKPNLETNINLHKAEMIQYIILGKIWDKKIPEKKEREKMKKLLNEQEKFLNL